MLEELESRLEGLNAGVKEVLLACAAPRRQVRSRHIRGLLADLFRANVETASLIDVVLGEKAQHFAVTADPQLMAFLEQESQRFKGRVGFIPLDSPHQLSVVAADLSQTPGVLGRADRFIETHDDLLPLAERLLGRTWVVEDLSRALALAASSPHGATFVTLAGELVAADGTISLGPRQASLGLLSRRSELRALRQLIVEFEASMATRMAELVQLEQQIEKQTEQVKTAAAELQRAEQAVQEHRLQMNASQARRTQLELQCAALDAELTAAATQHESTAPRLVVARKRLADFEAQQASQVVAIAELSEQADRLTLQRHEVEQSATAAKIALAKGEERLGSLRRDGCNSNAIRSNGSGRGRGSDPTGTTPPADLRGGSQHPGGRVAVGRAVSGQRTRAGRNHGARTAA